MRIEDFHQTCKSPLRILLLLSYSDVMIHKEMNNGDEVLITVNCCRNFNIMLSTKASGETTALSGTDNTGVR